MTQEITTQQAGALATQPARDPASLTGQLTPASFAKYRQDWGAYITWCATTGAAAHDPVSLAQWRAHRVGETAHSPHTSNRQIAAVKRIVREATASVYIPAAGALPFAQIAGAKPGAGRARMKPGTRSIPADMRRLYDTPDPRPTRGKRDRAVAHSDRQQGPHFCASRTPGRPRHPVRRPVLCAGAGQGPGGTVRGPSNPRGL